MTNTVTATTSLVAEILTDQREQLAEEIERENAQRRGARRAEWQKGLIGRDGLMLLAR
jgi:hypothetical protein